MPGFSQTQTCPMISEVFQTLSGPISKICFAESDTVVSIFPLKIGELGHSTFIYVNLFSFLSLAMRESWQV